MAQPGNSWTTRFLFLLGFFLLASPAEAAELTASTQASGGEGSSAGFRLRSAIGEPTIGRSTGPSRVSILGFLAGLFQIDSTPPATPVVTDDGGYTTSTTQLHATWTSADAESGIAEYQYAIGTTAGGTDVVNWTSAGTATEVTRTGLSLTHGTTYFFSVKARNGAGIWSAVGTSDGIAVDENAPVISGLVPADGTSFTEGDSVTIAVTASDVDGDSLEYQFLVDGIVARSWGSSAAFVWDTTGRAKSHVVTVQVRDGLGREAQGQLRLFGYRRPVPPP